MTNRNRRICAGLLCLLSCIGCSNRHENRATIGGEVRLDGKLVERGSILLLPMEGVEGAPAGGEILDGRYRLAGKAGAAVGWNRVEIHALRKTGKMIPKPFPARGKMMEEQVEAVPPRYNVQSQLKFEVKPGENTADFEMNSR